MKGNIRKAIAQVSDNTASEPGRLTVLAHPDNVALLEDVTSTGGRTVAEEFTRFAGALIYPSSAVPTGFMIVANLAVSCKFLQASRHPDPHRGRDQDKRADALDGHHRRVRDRRDSDYAIKQDVVA